MPTDPTKTLPSRFARLRAWRDRIPLTREGLLWFAIATALLLVGLFKGINLITLLASFFVAMVAWNWWEARRQVRRLRARRIDSPAFAQTPHRTVIRVENVAPRTASGVRVRTGAANAERTWFITELAGRSHTELEAVITYPRRGYADARSLTLESGHPLALARVRAMADSGSPQLVFPRLGVLHKAQLRRFLSRRSPSLGQTRGLPCHAPTAQAEFHGLRSYRPGDSLRHLHWRTTARRGELMVREYEDWPNDDLTVVLEARKAPGEGDDPLLEDAISLAATICWEWCRQTGDRLLLAVAGASVTTQHGVTGHTLACDLLGRLALEPGATAIDTGELFAKLYGCHISPGPILVISPSESNLASRLQLALRRRTAEAVVSSGDAGIFFEL